MSYKKCLDSQKGIKSAKEAAQYCKNKTGKASKAPTWSWITIVILTSLLIASGIYIFLIPATSGSGYVEGYDAGYDVGLIAGNATGYLQGFTEGNTTGYLQGFTEGNASGYIQGYNEGYAAGYALGNTSDYDQGWIDGNSTGWILGYDAGFLAGNQSGYDSGLIAGNQSGYALGYGDGYIAGLVAGAIKYSRNISPEIDGYLDFEEWQYADLSYTHYMNSNASLGNSAMDYLYIGRNSTDLNILADICSETIENISTYAYDWMNLGLNLNRTFSNETTFSSYLNNGTESLMIQTNATGIENWNSTVKATTPKYNNPDYSIIMSDAVLTEWDESFILDDDYAECWSDDDESSFQMQFTYSMTDIYPEYEAGDEFNGTITLDITSMDIILLPKVIDAITVVWVNDPEIPITLITEFDGITELYFDSNDINGFGNLSFTIIFIEVDGYFGVYFDYLAIEANYSYETNSILMNYQAVRGFNGTINSWTPHVIWEISIKLSELEGFGNNQTLGIFLIGSNMVPFNVYDLYLSSWIFSTGVIDAYSVYNSDNYIYYTLDTGHILPGYSGIMIPIGILSIFMLKKKLKLKLLIK